MRKIIKQTLCITLSAALLCSFANVEVNKAATKKKNSKKIELSEKKLTLVIGKSKKVTLKNANRKKVNWSTSNKKIATVKSGKITAKKKGNCVIKAKYLKKTYRCKVQVVKTIDNQMPANDPNVPANPGSTTPGDNMYTPSTGLTPADPTKGKLIVRAYDATTKTIDLTVTNYTDQEYAIGPYSIILKQLVDSAWVDIPQKSVAIPDIAMVVNKKGDTEWSIKLSERIEDLKPGTYMATIEVFGLGTVSAEFNV